MEGRDDRVKEIRASSSPWLSAAPGILKNSAEVVAFVIVVAAANRLGPLEPVFVSSAVNPYVAFSIFAAVWFGPGYGLLAFLASLASLLLPFPSGVNGQGISLLLENRIALLWTLVAIYGFGLIHDRNADLLGAKTRFLRRAASEKERLGREVKALVEVNRELEERVLRQQESITSLFSRIRDLKAQSVGEALTVLLDMVCQYSWASKASVWSYRPVESYLDCEASVGWDEDERSLVRIPVGESIEGWVARNNLLFSARMLVNYANLRKMDKGRNVMAFPISFGKTVWGVLNIEEMPFSKFNLYTEKILGVLIELSLPALERTITGERLMLTEIHPHTGFPLQSVLRRRMDQWTVGPEYRGSTFSVIVLELSGFESMVAGFGEDKSYALLKKWMAEIQALSGNAIEVFHYLKEGKIALFYPQIDYDGTALFCLELITMLNGQSWEIDGRAVPMDILMGYANNGKGDLDADSILAAAEDVLARQKRSA